MKLDDVLEIYAVIRQAKKTLQAQKKGDEAELPEIHQELFGRNKEIRITVVDIEP